MCNILILYWGGLCGCNVDLIWGQGSAVQLQVSLATSFLTFHFIFAVQRNFTPAEIGASPFSNGSSCGKRPQLLPPHSLCLALCPIPSASPNYLCKLNCNNTFANSGTCHSGRPQNRKGHPYNNHIYQVKLVRCVPSLSCYLSVDWSNDGTSLSLSLSLSLSVNNE